MNHKELYTLLDLPLEVVEKLNVYGENRSFILSEELKARLLQRSTWEDALKELQKSLGDDSDGLFVLWEQLDLICSYTWPKYKERGISQEVFAATMGFCNRFLREHFNTYGSYKFVWAWWYPRQFSLNEFRIGALEYEFIDGENREISIHIPSDADFSPASVESSVESFFAFRKAKMPDWEEVPVVCDSWMLSPVLKELMDENANIISFQNRFEIDSVEYDAPYYMDWVFPGRKEIDETLPEKTSLQRRMKAWLLSGKKVGCAKGHLKNI